MIKGLFNTIGPDQIEVSADLDRKLSGSASKAQRSGIFHGTVTYRNTNGQDGSVCEMKAKGRV